MNWMAIDVSDVSVAPCMWSSIAAEAPGPPSTASAAPTINTSRLIGA